jgi:hypothetical protein
VVANMTGLSNAENLQYSITYLFPTEKLKMEREANNSVDFITKENLTSFLASVRFSRNRFLVTVYKVDSSSFLLRYFNIFDCLKISSVAFYTIFQCVFDCL